MDKNQKNGTRTTTMAAWLGASALPSLRDSADRSYDAQ